MMETMLARLQALTIALTVVTYGVWLISVGLQAL